jgi:transposase-like protein
MPQKTMRDLARELGIGERRFYRRLARNEPLALTALQAETVWRHRDMLTHLCAELDRAAAMLRRTNGELAGDAIALAKKLRELIESSKSLSKRPAADWAELQPDAPIEVDLTLLLT